MRRSRTVSRPNSLVCPLCGSGELHRVSHDCARCASCMAGRWSSYARLLPYRMPWAGMPASAVTPRCAVSPMGSSTALPVAPKCSPSTKHEYMRLLPIFERSTQEVVLAP